MAPRRASPQLVSLCVPTQATTHDGAATSWQPPRHRTAAGARDGCPSSVDVAAARRSTDVAVLAHTRHLRRAGHADRERRMVLGRLWARALCGAFGLPKKKKKRTRRHAVRERRKIIYRASWLPRRRRTLARTHARRHDVAPVARDAAVASWRRAGWHVAGLAGARDQVLAGRGSRERRCRVVAGSLAEDACACRRGSAPGAVQLARARRRACVARQARALNLVAGVAGRPRGIGRRSQRGALQLCGIKQTENAVEKAPAPSLGVSVWPVAGVHGDGHAKHSTYGCTHSGSRQTSR